MEWIKVEDRSHSMPKHTDFKIKYEDGTESYFSDKHKPLLITHWRLLSEREQQLKQAIKEHCENWILDCPIENTDEDNFNQISSIVLSTPSILLHADPDVMDAAGWMQKPKTKREDENS